MLFVGGYGGLGRHALLTLLRMFPGHFKGIVFCSVAVIDSGVFKGIDEVHELEQRTQRGARQVRAVRGWLGLPAESTFSTGIEVAVEAEKIATELIQKYPKGLFVAGQLIFEEDTFVDAHPPQRDGVHDPAAAAARGRADGRAAGEAEPEGRAAPRGAQPDGGARGV